MDSEKERLPVYNPFFFSYKNQWYLELAATEQRYVWKATLPAQSYLGFPIAASSVETRYIEVRTSAELRYGFTDRIIAFVGGTYLADRDSSTTTTGSASFSSNYARTGMGNPHFGLIGRLLGTHRNAWYLDATGVYTPGIRPDDKNQMVASPMTTFEAGIALGRNFNAWTVGVAGNVAYSPEITYGSITYRSSTAVFFDGGLQYDFGPFFLNGRAGFMKYVDSVSVNDALNGKIRVVLMLDAGTKIADRGFVKISYGWLLPVSADYNSSGLNFVIEDKGGPMARLAIGVSF